MKLVDEIEEYQTERGVVPFRNWLIKLKDKRAIAKIHARIDRASLGNFGDWKDIKGAKGVLKCESIMALATGCFTRSSTGKLFCCW